MAIEDDLIVLVDEQEAAQAALVSQAIAALRTPLAGFQDWYSYTAVSRVVRLLASLLGAFQAAIARNTDAYMANAITIATGRQFRPAGIRRTELGRIGVDEASVLGRVANAYRWQQSEIDRVLISSVRTGRLLPLPVDPHEAALDRLDNIVQTNLQVTARAQQQTTLAAADTKIRGYRRIIHPELAKEGTCGLCIAASGRIYKVGTLLPIHPGCHCTVLPITGSLDSQVINEIDYRQLYGHAGSTAAESLRNTRFRVDEHGELGPILSPADQPIRTESQANQSRKTPEQRQSTLERKRQSMATDLNAFRARRVQHPDRFGGPEWDSVEAALANRVSDLESAA